MIKRFQPSWETFVIRLLWLFWPPAILILSKVFGILPEIGASLVVLVAVWTTIGVIQAIWLKGRKIELRDSQAIVITDLLDREYSYDFKFIEHPRLETFSHWPFPPKRCLSFSYHEGGIIKYLISELSADDQERIIALLKMSFKDWQEVEL